MKKFLIYGFVAVFALTGCKKEESTTNQEELAQQAALAQASRQELEAAIAERDELLDIINGINESISEIQSVERIVTVNGVGEGGQRATITSNLSTIKSTLAERRQRLATLESKLRESNLSNTRLLETIDGLKRQIEEQTAIIENLTTTLESANRRIGELGVQVDSLNTEVSNVTEQRNIAQEEALRQADIANECFYAVGSKKELKEHNIIESGFLRKTKVMPEDFDKSYFVKADKRTLRTIPLHAKKAKVVTPAQPAGSYEIVETNGQLRLNILNPSEFWGVSNFVVIQLD